MRYSQQWKDYELLDASEGERLERWGNIILIRPDPQVVWKTPKTNPLWKQANGRYFRSNKGGGNWEIYKKIPDVWSINYGKLKFNLKPMGFKHTGLFPEQAVNWDFFSDLIRERVNDGEEINVLNLFGYTGAATLACAEAGASVCHVDASKGMVTWGRENAVESGLSDKSIRWIVDDCVKFVEREIRRGRKYHGIIMDPPSYGRGPNGEVWKLEEKIFDLIDLCSGVLADNPLFVAVNSYTTGLSPSVMEYMLSAVMKKKFGGTTTSDEIGIMVSNTKMVLPCGGTAMWLRK